MRIKCLMGLYHKSDLKENKTDTNCMKYGKFTGYRRMYFLLSAAKLKYLLLFLVIFISCLNARIIYTWGSGTNDFKKYINNANYNYKNILVLGVDADWEAAIDLKNEYDFDLVIPVSKDGNFTEDSVKAALSKLGIPINSITIGTLDDIKGKSINNLFAHSWGSSETINVIGMNDTIRVKNLHAIGSPHSILWSSLGESIERGKINKVYFHANEGDYISGIFKNFPSALGGKFTSRIEIHEYTTKSNSVDTIVKEPAVNIPIFNASLGFKKYEHYNCPGRGHGLEDEYFKNMSFSLNRDPQNSPFKGSIPPFYTVPSYWTSPNQPQSLTEAQTMTDMVHGKNRALIVGDGTEAQLMYDNMSKKLGETNVDWLKIPSSAFGSESQLQRQLQSYARGMGADVILGVRGGYNTTLNSSSSSPSSSSGNTDTPDDFLKFPAHLPTLEQERFGKRAIPGPFPPDDFGGAGIPTTNSTISSQGAKPGDLLIRHEGKTLGPIGIKGIEVPHIGIYVGDQTMEGSSFNVIDLGIKDGSGIIRSSNWADERNFKDPGFYSVLDSRIPVTYNGKIIPMSALPSGVKDEIRGAVVKLAVDSLNTNLGKYEFTQFPSGHSKNCGDFVLDTFDKALSEEGIQVMSHKFPGSDLFGESGLKQGRLKNYAELFFGTTDPSRLSAWLPQVSNLGITPVGSGNEGGVVINPEPVSIGKGGSETKKAVLGSRPPSDDVLSWSFEIP